MTFWRLWTKFEAMAKKKKKHVQRNPSLNERLAGYRQAGKWEAFAALYLRDPEASSRTPWAQRWPDVLCNCLTKALFINRDLQSTREFASRLLNETGGGAKADMARIALDFLNMRADAASKPSPLIAESQLPAPWRELRAALAQAASQPKKRGRAALSPGAALLKKLQTRFAALSGAGTLTPFTGFLRLAEEFEVIAKGTAAENAARSIRAQAVLLRDLGKRQGGGADGIRNLDRLEKHGQFRELADGSMPSAVLGVWDFFCSLGGRKFGRDWENAVRTLRLAFDRRTDPELSTAFRQVVFPPSGKSRLFWLTRAEKYGCWSEQERYLLSFLCAYEMYRDEDVDFRDTPVQMIPGWTQTVTEIGRARRPESPWPVQMAEMLEGMLLENSSMYLPLIRLLDVPYESQTAVGLILLAFRMGYLDKIRNSAAVHRLPLSLSGDELSLLVQFLVFHPPKTARIDELAAMVKPDVFSRLANQWVLYAVVSSGYMTANGQSTTPWDRLAEGQTLDILATYLHIGGLPRAFCRLCHGTGRRLSDDETLRRDFQDILQKEAADMPWSGRTSPASKPDRDADNAVGQMHDKFSAGLFLLLTAWPQADGRIMQPLFKLAVYSFDAEDLWDDVVQAVDAIKDPDRKKEIIDCVRFVLDKIPRRLMTEGIGYVRKIFRDMSKGKSQVNRDRLSAMFLPGLSPRQRN
jgi:hypothetical protein